MRSLFRAPVRSIALVWGLVVFMPVGLNYLCYFALLLALLLSPERTLRLRRVRAHLLFWPMALFLLWTLVVLALQPDWYPETPTNLWHGGRIALTLAMAIALGEEEARWAMRGFVAAAAFSVLVVAVNAAVGLPQWTVWNNLIHYGGNKTVSNTILMALLAGSALVLALARGGLVRMAAIGVTLAVLAVLVFALPNRTALLAVLGAGLAAGVHQLRRVRLALLAFVAAAMLASAAFVTMVPAVQSRLALGLAEIREANSGEVNRDSWNIRVQLVRHTAAMIAERPWMGWGIGAWNAQWRSRVPPSIADLNMPHDDLLWMGAQAGVPGALSWLAIMLAACLAGWRRQDMAGRMAFVAALTLLFSALVNSATRDATIGLSLLWVVGLYLRLSAEPGFAPSQLRLRHAQG